MIISDEKVSYRTQVRAPQVYAMINACRLMQEAYQLFGSGNKRVSMPGGLGLNQKEASWLASQNPLLLDRLQYFRQTALASHFVCGNWKTCDELEADDPSYLSRGALRQQGQTTDFGGRTSGMQRFMPQTPDFMWLRRLIHSVVIWDVAEGRTGQTIREVAMCSDNWDVIAERLEYELQKAVGSDYNPWHQYVQQS